MRVYLISFFIYFNFFLFIFLNYSLQILINANNSSNNNINKIISILLITFWVLGAQFDSSMVPIVSQLHAQQVCLVICFFYNTNQQCRYASTSSLTAKILEIRLFKRYSMILSPPIGSPANKLHQLMTALTQMVWQARNISILGLIGAESVKTGTYLMLWGSAT